jgi:hypothetical protein
VNKKEVESIEGESIRRAVRINQHKYLNVIGLDVIGLNVISLNVNIVLVCVFSPPFPNQLLENQILVAKQQAVPKSRLQLVC